MNKVILKIDGMSCSGCSNGLEKYLNKQKGIESASVNLVLAQAMINYDDTLTIKDLENFIAEAGFQSLGVFTNKEQNKKDYSKTSLTLFAILACIVMYISMGHMIHLPIISYLNMMKYPINYTLCLFILTIPFLIYGWDIFKSGIKNTIHKSPNMDTLVTIGVITSLIYSLFSMVMVLKGKYNYVENLYFESCAIVIFFVKLGRFIDKKSKMKTTEAIKDLVQITPSKALLKVGDTEKEVTIDEVKKGDILICKPGMKVAVDGIIIEGQSHFDEAFITGESLPSKKKVNDEVVAGSINLDGYILYKALKIGKDSTISEIVKLVVEATNTKSPIQKTADKVAGYFVPAIVLIAFLTFIGYLVFAFPLSEAITSFVTVLVVACPCALGLATPLAVVVGMGLTAKEGILIKSSEILENAHKVDTVVFDKTGTLTYGNLKISKIYNFSEKSDEELIKIVASIEQNSTHPIAKAFTNHALNKKINLINVASFEEISGIGLKALIKEKEIYIGNNKLFKKLKIENNYQKEEEQLTNLANSVVYVIADKKVIGLIGIRDTVRDNAKIVINKLNKIGIDTIMLTGDNINTANIIAKETNIKKVMADMLPRDKTNAIKQLIKEGHNVMMVGDGVNDAPSLAISNVGVSIGSGTDIATNSSSVILINDNLDKILLLIDISKKTLTKIKQNLFWAFFYNLCMIPIAIGLLKPFNISMNPMLASLAMMFSSLTVVFNSLRLKQKN